MRIECETMLSTPLAIKSLSARSLGNSCSYTLRIQVRDSNKKVTLAHNIIKGCFVKLPVKLSSHRGERQIYLCVGKAACHKLSLVPYQGR